MPAKGSFFQGRTRLAERKGEGEGDRLGSRLAFSSRWAVLRQEEQHASRLDG